ncbi:tRNA uridine-5-carboxymethylaminomethyl(34) synthesis GTPase MnmE [Sulfurovum sp. bin170]|uniref:tRNA uridine-5-carboxymethylaminomethyl(34) synthesis GTPase MnmE n=1 Tax=Sulfurovum sp. bin170 TaxID=2695268 RepID=UPI0013DF9A73|nr:tRNA uridine-5-carboxymethylaminomethyl(34) synthesis GTPase MnmE [Sulfurovum sp. bin170]NEW59742.1 tRNA uridine-5-carboxymethylaminomethyl(34) synthesis GTPase MnmE [Sulfurovum sp. bin170]
MSSTIVAIATALGVSSISIVRVSGDNALSIARKITKKNIIEPRVAHLNSLYNHENQLIDQAIVIYFINPKSFTGEDIVEFQCHGGMIVAGEILETTIAYGARLAEPGEFSKRAFLNGKIDLTKAEAIAKLIETKSVEGAKILAKQLKGNLKNFIDESREALLRATAYSEVMIDYAEEDMPDDILDNIVRQLDNLTEQIEKIVDSSHRRKGLIEGFRVAIIGKPNVGKSSLLNALLSYDRAIVSEIAGTTRDTIEEQVRIGSHIIRLIDTAGIREANDTIEKIGVERSLESIEDADVIIALFDGSSSFDNEDAKILEILDNSEDKQIIVAVNKSDLEQKFDIEKLKSSTLIEVSAKHDFKKLTDKLEELFNNIGTDEELMLISTRQIEAVERTKQAISDAKEPLINGELEFFSYHLQDAVTALSSISKPYDSEEILDKMFGEFCLGK